MGIAFENNGRMYVWERTGRVWFKDPADPSFSLLLDISEEVGTWEDHGMLGFALDPNFRVNGYIYLLYVVDRYYLLNFGTPGYNSTQNQYSQATIGRLTRYTCRSSDGFRSVSSSSRLILIGDTKQNGFPILSYTHGIGSLVFGEDGTLLISCGDGATASGVDQGGAASGSYASQGLADGIIRSKEDIGAIRSQLIDCLNGKVLRIDPATGNGLPSNPYYDAANPRSARSRVWALGLRNPFRMSLRPDTGSHSPADANPGVLYVGNVGWNIWESLEIVTRAGQNFGWPLFEGLSLTPGYDLNVDDLDALNPLYPATGCNRYFRFKDLLKEDTLAAAGQPPFANPCNSSQRIPSSIPQFLHTRSVLDWNHTTSSTRTPTYGGSGQAQIANVGAAGSPVSGTQFQGNCAVGGTWYTGTNFPARYQNTYFFADWGQGVIKNLTFDANDKPMALSDFATAAGAVVCVVQHPADGSLYYISYNFTAATIHKVVFAGSRTPIVSASADRSYGPTPLTVQFTGGGSTDPDGGPLTYSWSFGDGSASSAAANPSHLFSAPAGVPTKFVVTLTVTNSRGLSAQTSLVVAVNDTPPNVAITSPVDGSLYSPSNGTTVNLIATVTDAESPDSKLLYQWQTLLHHNDHNHSSPVDTNHVTTADLSPTGCDGINIYYSRILLTVTDPSGLSTTREVRLFPNCGPNTPPVISAIAAQSVNQDRATPPLAFTVGDAETPAANLQLSGSSSNPALVPPENIVFGGSGANRTVTVTPGLGRTGTATVTVTVNDGPNNASSSFGLTVNPAPAGTATFTNTTPIGIPSIGAATPYPSYINVTGVSGTVTNLTVTLRGLSHTYGNDIDILLVGPGGQKLTLLSDAGTGPFNPADFTFSDKAATLLPQTGALAGGTYKPTDYPPATTYPSPAPPGPYASSLSTFNGVPASGFWALYVFDDGAGDSGSMAGGWSFTVTTVSLTGATPTISSIPDLSTPINTATSALPFTIADADTPLTSLTLSKGSSNPTLVPTNNIVLGGSGANRTVTLIPAANQTGVATITIGVSDGVNQASDAFVLTVMALNTPPTISGIPAQTIDEDTSTGPLSFTVADNETTAASLIVSKSSSNPTLVPLNNITLSGSGANRTVTVTPVTNLSGVATITLSVSDGQYVVSTNFLVTVNAVNDPPELSPIGDQVIWMGGSTGPLLFTVMDVDTPLTSLTVMGSAADPVLVPNANIVLSGNGANRTVTVTPPAGLAGTTIITLTVSDGLTNSSTSFQLTVNSSAVNALRPIFVDQTSSATDGTGEEFNGTTLELTADNSNNLLIVAWHSEFDGGFPDSWVVECSGMPGTLIADTNGYTDGDGNRRFRSYYWQNLPPGPLTVVVTNTDYAGGNELAVSAVLFTNVAPLAPLGSLSLDVSTANRTSETETVATTSNDLVVHIIADALFNRGALGSGETSRSIANDGQHTIDGDASLWISTKPGESSTTSVSSSGWASRVLNGLALVLHGPVPGAPEIGRIPDQTTSIDTPTPPISFIVGDLDTPAESLTLSGFSSNPALVPEANIVFGGSGSDRTVTLIPTGGQPGSAVIGILVSDGTQTASITFLLLVTPVAGGPVAAYSFDEGTGTTVADASGNGNDGTISSATWTTAGKYCGALSFSGSSARVTIPDSASLHLTAGMTLEAWVKPSSVSSAWRDVIYKGTDNYYLMGTTSNGGYPGAGGFFDGVNVNLFGASVLDVNAWSHLAVTYDGAMLRLFLNGTVIANQDQTGDIRVSGSPLQIGGDSIFGQNFQGIIDEVRVYNRALSLAEIQVDMDKSVSPPPNTPPTISPLGAQAIDEGTTLGPLALVVGDAETPAGSLVLSADSSNPGLIPLRGIVFGGTGSNRTVTVKPVANQYGTATVILRVSDGTLGANAPFDLNVRQVDARLAIASVGSDGVVVLRITGPSGAHFVIEASADLLNWTPVGVVDGLSGGGLFTDADAVGNDRRFYRILENP